MVAEWLGSNYVDYEQELERRVNRPLSIARAVLGGRALREIENDLAGDLSERDDYVLSATPGAGVAGAASLKFRPDKVFLLVDPESSEGSPRGSRSRSRTERAALLALGNRLCSSRAHLHILTVSEPLPGALAYKVLTSLDQPAPRIFTSEVHPVLFASDGYSYLLSWLKAQSGDPPDQVILVVSDSFPTDAIRSLRKIHLAAGFAPISRVLRVPSSERFRTPETLCKLWRSISRIPGLNKKDMLIALGPRNVMHLAAALAATTLGGLRLVLVPVTLSSMIESGAGSSGTLRLRSSGLPLQFSCFPIVSLIDPLRLLLSSEEDLREGYLSILRIALIGDPVLFDRIDQWSREGRPFAHRFGEISWVLERALRIRLRLLEQDAPGTDRALTLRLGEPFYSALLQASRFTYSGASAGASAVALALAFSCSLGALPPHTEDRVLSLLKRLGLPATVPDFIDFEDFFNALKNDPYASRDLLVLPLPTSIGSISLFQTSLASFKPALARVWSSLLPAARA